MQLIGRPKVTLATDTTLGATPGTRRGVSASQWPTLLVTRELTSPSLRRWRITTLLKVCSEKYILTQLVKILKLTDIIKMADESMTKQYCPIIQYTVM